MIFRRLRIALVLMAALAAAASFAKGPNAHETEFQAFRKELLAAAAANDKAKIADLIGYPVEYWTVETKNSSDEVAVANRADFLARYDTLFTASMRAHLAKAKPESLDNGRYLLSWVEGGSEYTFVAEYQDAVGWRLRAYGSGAY